MINATHVAGFMFSSDREQVLLIRKNRPHWQRNLLNGVGGKIEAGESPHVAMVREFQEEAGIDTANYGISWEHFATLDASNNGAVIDFFMAESDYIYATADQTDEPLEIIHVDQVWRNATIPNIPMLLAIALDDSGIVKPVVLVDKHPIRP